MPSSIGSLDPAETTCRIGAEKDWTDDGPRGRFLHAEALGACRYFSVVLTPATNGLHRGHLHLDIGPDRLCSIG